MAFALKAWAILIPLILAFFTAFKVRTTKLTKENRELRAQTDVVESRLKLASELNTGEAEAIEQIQTEIAGLRQLIKAKRGSNVVEPIIKEADSSAAALMMANRTTNHILTAKNIAISGTRRRRFARHDHNEWSFNMLMILVPLAALAILVLVGVSAD
jgi:hypothetical protein